DDDGAVALEGLAFEGLLGEEDDVVEVVNARRAKARLVVEAEGPDGAAVVHVEADAAAGACALRILFERGEAAPLDDRVDLFAPVVVVARAGTGGEAVFVWGGKRAP